MSKKRDPIVTVMQYFETVDLPLAQQALSLAQGIVKARLPFAGKAPKAKVKRAAPVAVTN